MTVFKHAVEADRFVDIVTGVDPSKFSKGSGRIGDDVRRRGLGFGADGRSIHTTSQVPVPDLIPYSKHAKTTTASSSIQSLILLNSFIVIFLRAKDKKTQLYYYY